MVDSFLNSVLYISLKAFSFDWTLLYVIFKSFRHTLCLTWVVYVVVTLLKSYPGAVFPKWWLHTHVAPAHLVVFVLGVSAIVVRANVGFLYWWYIYQLTDRVSFIILWRGVWYWKECGVWESRICVWVVYHFSTPQPWVYIRIGTKWSCIYFVKYEQILNA